MINSKFPVVGLEVTFMSGLGSTLLKILTKKIEEQIPNLLTRDLRYPVFVNLNKGKYCRPKYFFGLILGSKIHLPLNIKGVYQYVFYADSNTDMKKVKSNILQKLHPAFVGQIHKISVIDN